VQSGDVPAGGIQAEAPQSRIYLDVQASGSASEVSLAAGDTSGRIGKVMEGFGTY